MRAIFPGDLPINLCSFRHIRTFSDEMEPLTGPLIVPHAVQSMSSSVANSVRREAQAVIAAIITACAASAR